MDISVIIPTYNRAHLLHPLLSTLLIQDTENLSLEIIVVNDGSADNTMEVLEQFRQDGSNQGHVIKIVHQTNSGQAKARHAGFLKSSGTYLLFIDDDMELKDSSFIKSHLTEQKKLHNAVVYGKILPRKEPTKTRLSFEKYYEDKILENYADFASGVKSPSGRHFFTANVSMPRSLYEQSQGFDPFFRYLEDIEFGVRLQKNHSATFAYCEKAASYHNSGSASFEAFTNRARLYGKYENHLYKMYPEDESLNPLRFLNTGSKLFMNKMISSNKLFILCSKPLQGLSIILNYLGLINLSVKACRLVYKIHFVEGLVAQFQSSKELIGCLNKYRSSKYANQAIN